MKLITIPSSGQVTGDDLVNFQLGLQLLLETRKVVFPLAELPLIRQKLMEEQAVPIYGDATKQIVKELQRIIVVPIDGVVDSHLSEHMNWQLRDLGAFPLRLIPFPHTQLIDESSSIDEIYNLQSGLLALLQNQSIGFSDSLRTDSIDKLRMEMNSPFFGAGTAEAVMVFQASAGFPPTGRLVELEEIRQFNIRLLATGEVPDVSFAVLRVAMEDLPVGGSTRDPLLAKIESFKNPGSDANQFWRAVDRGELTFSDKERDQLPALRLVHEIAKYLDYNLDAIDTQPANSAPAKNIRQTVFALAENPRMLVDALDVDFETNPERKVYLQKLADRARVSLLRDFSSAARLPGLCKICNFDPIDPMFGAGTIGPLGRSTLQFLCDSVLVGVRGRFFDFASSTIDEFPELLPASQDARDSIRREIEIVRDLDQICASEGALAALLGNDFRSLSQIARRAKKPFVNAIREQIGEEEATAIHDRAITLCSIQVAAALQANHALSSDRPAAVPLPFKELPSWAKMFGPTGQCECGKCRSITSPAAYFVDLLNYLASCGDPLDPTFLEKLSQGIMPARTVQRTPNLLEELLRIRPDIANLKLSCENTETSIPYIDLVNEILEAFVVHNGDLTSAVQNVADESPEELRSQPQHVSDAAYRLLAKAVFPSKLPYDRSSHLIRELIKQSGLRLEDVLTTFLSDEQVAANLDMRHQGACDFLEITQAEFTALTGGESAVSTKSLLGLPEDHVGSVADAVETVSVLLNRLGVNYEQLKAALKARFINTDLATPSSALSITFPSDMPVETICDTRLMKLRRGDGAPVVDADIRRLVEFVRLWRHLPWSFDEVDRALEVFEKRRAITPGLIENIALTEQLRQTTGVGIVSLLGLWRTTIDVDGPNSLYERVFQGQIKLPGSALSSVTVAEKAAALAAALALRIDDVIAFGSASAKLSLAFLAELYAHNLLSKWIQWPISATQMMVRLSGMNPFVGPRETLLFLKMVADVRRRGLSYDDISVMCQFRASSAFTGNDDLEARSLSIAKLLNPAELFSVTSDDTEISRDRLVQKLRSIDSITDVDTAADIVYGERLVRFSEPRYNTVLGQLRSSGLVAADFSLFLDPFKEEASQDRVLKVLENIERLQQAANSTLVRAKLLEDVRSLSGLDRDQFDAAHSLPMFKSLFELQSNDDTQRVQESRKFLFACHLIRRLRLDAQEEIALFLGEPLNNVPGLQSMFDEIAPSAIRFQSLLGATRSVTLRERLLPQDISLKDVALADESAADSILSKILNIEVPVQLRTEIWPSEERVDLTLLRLERTKLVCQSLQVTPIWLRSWLVSPVTERAELLTSVLREKQSSSAWFERIKPVYDRIREAGRSALVSLVTHRLGMVNKNEVFDHLLIDAEMNSVMQTSRLKQAIASVQLFVQRCLLNLVPGVNPDVVDVEQWEIRKSFRLWEANRRVALYPENWLQPSLRINKTAPFRELEARLLQGPVTSSAAEAAVREYCEKLDEVGQLEICGFCRDEANEAVHVFGRTTRGIPRRYFHRVFRGGEWSGWETIDVEITGVEQDDFNPTGIHIMPVNWKGRLHLFWLTVIQKASPPPPPIGLPAGFKIPAGPVANMDFPVTAAQAPSPELRLAWSTFSTNGWTQKQVSGNSCPKLDIANLQNYCLRYIERDESLTIVVLISSLSVAQFQFDGRNDQWVAERINTRQDPSFPFIAVTTEYSRSRQHLLASTDDTRNGLFVSTMAGRKQLLQVNDPPASSMVSDKSFRLTLSSALNNASEDDVPFNLRRNFFFNRSTEDLWCTFLDSGFDRMHVLPFSHGQTTAFLDRLQRGGIGALYDGKTQNLGSKYLKDNWEQRETFPSTGNRPVTIRDVDEQCMVGFIPDGSEIAVFIGPRTDFSARTIHWSEQFKLPGFPGARHCDFVVSRGMESIIAEILVPFENGSLVHFRREFLFETDTTNLKLTHDTTKDREFLVESDGSVLGTASLTDGGNGQLFAAVLKDDSKVHIYSFNGFSWTKDEAVSERATASPTLKLSNTFISGHKQILHLLVVESSELVHYRCELGPAQRVWVRYATIATLVEGPAALTSLEFDPVVDLHVVVQERGVYRHYYLNSFLSPPMWRPGAVICQKTEATVNLPSLCGNGAESPMNAFVSINGEMIRFEHIESNPYNDMSRRFALFPEATQFLFPLGEVDFSNGGAYSTYNWELFFHIPMLMGIRLSQSQLYAEAQRWFHFVFDPTYNSNEPLAERAWRFRPFRVPEIDGTSPLPFGDMANMFEPHGIARRRPMAYQKWVVARYVDNLISWADSLFSKGTIEAINEATQLYLLADRILGTRPERVAPQHASDAKSYAELIRGVGAGRSSTLAVKPQVSAVANGGLFLLGIEGAGTHFCVPPNDELLRFWDLVEDRLFKVRNSMDMNGVVRQLPLFESPLDPALFVAARSQGLTPSEALTQEQPLPNYRFNVLLQRALEACSEIKSLGAAITSAREKRDAEALAKIRAEQEVSFLSLAREGKLWQWRESSEAIRVLSATRQSAIVRLVHYAISLGERLSSIPSEPTGPKTPSDNREPPQSQLTDYVPKGNFQLDDWRGNDRFDVTVSGARLGSEAAQSVGQAKKVIIDYLGKILTLAVTAPLNQNNQSGPFGMLGGAQGGVMGSGAGGLGGGMFGGGVLGGGLIGGAIAVSEIPGVKDAINEIPVVGDVLTSGVDEVSDVFSSIGDGMKKVPVLGGLFGGDDSPLGFLADPSKLVTNFVSTAVEELLPRMLAPLDPIFEEAGKFLSNSFNTIVGEITQKNEIANSNTKVLHFEKQELHQMTRATEYNLMASYAEKVASILGTLPSMSVSFSPFGVGFSTSPPPISAAASAVARSNSAKGAWHSFQSTLASRMASFVWREREFALQRNLASREIAQIDRQIVAAKIREQIARREIIHHDAQISNARKVDEFLETKYSREELYTVTEQQLSELYRRAYRLAIDLARQAQRCYSHELAVEFDLDSVLGGFWDTETNGLFAGERLFHALKQMEKSYLERNTREIEITKQISLLQLDPHALIELRQTGQCQFEVPEIAFDMDFPGYYLRRIRSAAVTIPCVVGPATGINAEVTLLSSRVRTSDRFSPQYQESPEWGDERFSYRFGGPSSVAISHGQNDSGLFDLNLRDERYLPFEGAGACSRWQIRLPEIRTYDYSTIADVVLHLRYTARLGSSLFRQKAIANLKEEVRSVGGHGSLRLFSIRHEFPSEWSRWKSQANGERSKLALVLSRMHFPFWATEDDKIQSVQMFAVATNSISIFYGEASQAGERFDTLVPQSLPGMVGGQLEHFRTPIDFNETFDLFLDNQSATDVYLIVTFGPSQG